jgi:hypothetical protein
MPFGSRVTEKALFDVSSAAPHGSARRAVERRKAGRARGRRFIAGYASIPLMKTVRPYFFWFSHLTPEAVERA